MLLEELKRITEGVSFDIEDINDKNAPWMNLSYENLRIILRVINYDPGQDHGAIEVDEIPALKRHLGMIVSPALEVAERMEQIKQAERKVEWAEDNIEEYKREHGGKYDGFSSFYMRDEVKNLEDEVKRYTKKLDRLQKSVEASMKNRLMSRVVKSIMGETRKSTKEQSTRIKKNPETGKSEISRGAGIYSQGVDIDYIRSRIDKLEQMLEVAQREKKAITWG